MWVCVCVCVCVGVCVCVCVCIRRMWLHVCVCVCVRTRARVHLDLLTVLNVGGRAGAVTQEKCSDRTTSLVIKISNPDFIVLCTCYARPHTALPVQQECAVPIRI